MLQLAAAPTEQLAAAAQRVPTVTPGQASGAVDQAVANAIDLIKVGPGLIHSYSTPLLAAEADLHLHCQQQATTQQDMMKGLMQAAGKLAEGGIDNLTTGSQYAKQVDISAAALS